jgi:flagellar biosynthesis protein FlhG
VQDKQVLQRCSGFLLNATSSEELFAVMPDQAFRLRKLMHAGGRQADAAPADAPRVVAIAGAKGGVGTTTVALNLASAMAGDGRRTLLVDADPQRADVATLAGLRDGYCLADVLSGARSLHEAMQLGPAGIQVLLGRWGAHAALDWSARAQERFIYDLRNLGPHVDMILLDLGSVVDATTRQFWKAVDEIVLVTTADNVAVMNAYATVKTHADASRPLRVASLVNQSTDPSAAQDAHMRLQRACGRFLGVDVRTLGSIPQDTAVLAAAAAARPFVVQAPACAAAQELARSVDRLVVAKVHRQERTGFTQLRRG